MLLCQCHSSGVMQICSATTGFAIEDRYLIISCERAKIVELHACVRCFLRKNGMLIGLKTWIKETDNTSAIKCSFIHSKNLNLLSYINGNCKCDHCLRMQKKTKGFVFL